MISDPYNLERFLHAQSFVYDGVIAELGAGMKRTHWMWFIFPQIAGLGSSPTAVLYAITSREEAAAYVQHPVLGPRLCECTRLVNAVEGRSIDRIFGYPDDLKFHSSMTLFANATEDNEIFRSAIKKYFNGEMDLNTIQRL